MGKSKKKHRRGIHHRCNIGVRIFAATVVTGLLIAVWGAWGICNGKFRLDQFATTILGTTAGIVGTMFGLTAASYAFIWGDLRSDSQENRHLGKVLERYSQKLWYLFVCSLVLTVIVIFLSLTGLALAQTIADSTLFRTGFKGRTLISEYQNEKYQGVSFCTLANLLFSSIAVVAMMWMNWTIFKRNAQYMGIAESIIDEIENKYNMELKQRDEKSEYRESGNPEQGNEQQKSGIPNKLEYEKIHNLEILVERILKNHESIGDAFAESQRRETLLTTVISNELQASYELGSDMESKGTVSDKIRQKTEWRYLDVKKRENRWNKCNDLARQEYSLLINRKSGEKQKPCVCSFISVYDDLLTYRDNTLVWEERQRLKRRQADKNRTINMFERRALRYTIKRRLLIFYLRGETFSNMDLSGVSFSGADLRFANFSNCNLMNIRLKGTNCEGTDFTRSKMAGMYFSDIQESKNGEVGEIQLTCLDDSLEEWDPYTGREATCLRNTTFKEADVSRAYLKAPGELEGNQGFPFLASQSNKWKLGDEQSVFSLEGSNFDYAKMFFSYFKNVDFTNSSFEKAQMYNIGLVQSIARSVNLEKTTLTNACLAWCDFENADFTGASLAETILVRNNFGSAKMMDVNFSYSNIVSCNFKGASCQNASFKNMIQDLSAIEKNRPKALEDISLNVDAGIKFDYAILNNTDFSGAILNNVSFSNALGQDCVFTKAKGDNTNFNNALFSAAVFNMAEFKNSNFVNTLLCNSVLMGTRFINCRFCKTDFSGILVNMTDKPCFMGGIMWEVKFTNSNGLTAACFRNIHLHKVDFRGTGIQESDFFDDVIMQDCIF